MGSSGWSRTTKVWLAGSGLLVVTSALLRGLAPEGALTAVVTTLTVLWLLPGLLVAVRALWRWLTYRVGVRLFLSYLLIGVAPFLCCLALAMFAVYLLMGQYASTRFSNEVAMLAQDMQRGCQDAAQVYRSGGSRATRAVLESLARDNPFAVPQVLWLGRFGDEELRSPGSEEIPVPAWIDKAGGGLFLHDDTLFLTMFHSDSEATVAALVPLDTDTARALNRSPKLWFDVCFLPMVEGDTGSSDVRVSAGNRSFGLRMNSDDVDLEEIWGEWQPQDEKPLEAATVYWFRMSGGVRDLETGEELGAYRLLTLLRTSPANAWRDFTHSKYRLGWQLVTWFGVVTGLMLIVYGVAVTLAAKMIFTITRSTARLSRGAREVGRGRLDHRVPVRQKDQLGDLAVSFNRMTEAVQGMLADVAEKERLDHELELAREIQESLLPERHLVHGGLILRAEFRPAAKVGGDYFDVFSLRADHLVLAVGDVAGHGLHTGLHMAALKSSVAAMVHEGYTGSELLAKVNRLLLAQERGRTMATMAIIEVDPRERTIHLANAGHPPPYLLDDDGEPVELLAGSLPLGIGRCVPATLQVSYSPGSRLVIYTDGLVEAADTSGQPLGYDALLDLLRGLAAERCTGAEVMTAVLQGVDRHTGGQPLADDLTLLVLESLSPEEPAELSPPAVEEPDG